MAKEVLEYIWLPEHRSVFTQGFGGSFERVQPCIARALTRTRGLEHLFNYRAGVDQVSAKPAALLEIARRARPILADLLTQADNIRCKIGSSGPLPRRASLNRVCEQCQGRAGDGLLM